MRRSSCCSAIPRATDCFRIVPLLVFCYFVPALLSNTGVIPFESDVYVFIRRVLLPASLVGIIDAFVLQQIARWYGG
ncbi:MAG TPA: hypothetical protein VJ755_11860 [Gemmatimonadales bacterium]|nr:hypothetical protein [Gemmatimonadales bacterium]